MLYPGGVTPADPSLYSKLEGGAVQCLVCPRSCRLKPGSRGFCGVRENREGTLHSLSFGKVAAIHIDPIEKKPLARFLSGSLTWSIAAPGCSLRCPWCQNHPLLDPTLCVRSEIMPPARAAEVAHRSGCPSLSFTYSEPTVSLEYVRETFLEAKRLGLKTVLVTNGYLTQNARDFLSGVLDAANVDVKAFDEKSYNQTLGSLEPVMETVREWLNAGIHVEVTSLIVPGVNDELVAFEAFSKRAFQEWGQSTVWHLSAFRPAYRMLDHGPTPWSLLERLGGIARRVGFEYVVLGNRGLAA